ncbi:MAG: NADPH:quinone reductase [Propionibacteriaceae bacterium]|nr:NADPH:quinone reductase [Propionibacteriaceae bacterium]
MRIHLSGVNPTDTKFRSGVTMAGFSTAGGTVPGQDGAGVVVDTGAGVKLQPGDRVWLWECTWLRCEGTAQEFVVVPESHAVPLPDSAPWELGASLGIPGLTAHRCLTVGDGAPSVLEPGSLAGRTVLVAGGAGAVGHMAIQLAVWAGARVAATVRSPGKAGRALAAGAQLVVNPNDEIDAVSQVRAWAPEGVDTVVEVAPVSNADLNHAVVGYNATIAVYANEASSLALDVRALMVANTRYQFVLVYLVPDAAKAAGVAALRSAVEQGALSVGDGAGLPIRPHALSDMVGAHRAVERGADGKVVLDLRGDTAG